MGGTASSLSLWRVLAVALGMFGLLANVYGVFVGGPIASRPAVGPFAPEHFSRSLAPADTVTDFFSRPPAVADFHWLVTATDTVAEVLMHAHRTVTVGENWLLWLGGSVWYPLKDTQDAQKILAARGGICDDAANVLMAQLKRVGIISRFVAIGGRRGQPLGHAFLEVRLEDRWVIADPDYRVAFPFSLEELRQADGGARMLTSALAGQGWDRASTDLYIDIMLKNPVTRTASGEPLGDKLAIVEAAADVLKWPLALTFALAPFAGLRKRRRTERTSVAPSRPVPAVPGTEVVPVSVLAFSETGPTARDMKVTVRERPR